MKTAGAAYAAAAGQDNNCVAQNANCNVAQMAAHDIFLWQAQALEFLPPMGDGSQQADTHLTVRHASPNCNSYQLYKGILADRAKAVFNGRIVVDQDAQKTDAAMSNRNLLLSEGAEVDTKPQLEIYADDVKCSHGTTVGQLDDTALFYLRTRGLDKQDAMRALTRAFGASIVSHAPIALLADHLTETVEQRLSALTDGDDE